MRSNTRWEQTDECTYYLYFEAFYEEKQVATLVIENGDIYSRIPERDGCENFVCEYLDDSSIAYAKNEIETALEYHYEEMMNYYKSLYDRFTEV